MLKHRFMMLWLKLLHIGALTVWCSGLLVLPTLFAHRPAAAGSALHRLQRFSRRGYVQVISPAAFIAVASGVALIFTREVFMPWMVVKLAAVGALVMLHLRLGHVIQHIFDPGATYARWRYVASMLSLSFVMLVILALVLGKPSLPLTTLPTWLREAGSLQDLVEMFIPIP